VTRSVDLPSSRAVQQVVVDDELERGVRERQRERVADDELELRRVRARELDRGLREVEPRDAIAGARELDRDLAAAAAEVERRGAARRWRRLAGQERAEREVRPLLTFEQVIPAATAALADPAIGRFVVVVDAPCVVHAVSLAGASTMIRCRAGSG
jgi:hypothetical protein